MHTRISLFIYLALFASACSTKQHVPETEPTPPQHAEVSQVERDLHDIWVLERLGDLEIDATTFMKGAPTLELYPKKGTVTGHTGCNVLNGKLILGDENEVAFKQMATTKMACPGNQEAAFLQNLNRVNRYLREGLTLTLLQDEEPLLRFKKVD